MENRFWTFPICLVALGATELLCASGALAADTTPPTRPVVTDDGAYTTSTTTLHAAWTSSDPESGISQFQYQIRQDSTSGTLLIGWTSTGTAKGVTRADITLLQGKNYYFAVKAKNGDGLWSNIGYSNGIKVDTTPPSAPGTPTEGSSSDLDYDADGSYTVYWKAAADPESGVNRYEVQEQIGTTETWTTLGTTNSTKFSSVSGRLHNTRYFYRVRARNQAGLWGLWSAVSDGILVDKTIPSSVTVTDDGAVTYSTTSLHATWTAASDAESGIVQYQYLIRRDSMTGTIIVNWTSVGAATAVTRTGLSLVAGVSYYIGVRAHNGAGLYSTPAYSNGITVRADSTPPTTPVVTDTGTYTTSTTSLSATWTASDPESGLAQFQFQIRQDSTTGPILVDWTPTFSTTPPISVTYLGLNLQQGKTYYWAVKAKNGAGLWSAIGYSDGATVDPTAPSAPSQPKEGLVTISVDKDYDEDGFYRVFWDPAADPETGIHSYEIQERIGLSGIWATIGTRTGTELLAFDRLHNTQYFYQVRAKNGSGVWGAWSAVSDGILVDKTLPSTVQVTDDGATTASTTTLHAQWTAASDPESGITGYRYEIRQDSVSGAFIVYPTSVGLATEVTRTGLSLTPGKSYYFVVAAGNGAGLYSYSYSDGISVVAQNSSPVIGTVTPKDGSTYIEGDSLPVTVSASDPDGDPLEYQFLIDGQVNRSWSPTLPWTWVTAGFPKAHQLTVQVRDPAGHLVEASQELFGYRRPIAEPTP